MKVRLKESWIAKYKQSSFLQKYKKNRLSEKENKYIELSPEKSYTYK
jgi:hypothetical protein